MIGTRAPSALLLDFPPNKLMNKEGIISKTSRKCRGRKVLFEGGRCCCLGVEGLYIGNMYSQERDFDGAKRRYVLIMGK